MCEVTREDVQYTYSLVERICGEIGPGCPCSPQEHQRGRIFEEELRRFCPEVTLEAFECSPMAFLGWFRWAGLTAALSAIFLGLSLKPWNPLLFTLIAFLLAGAILFVIVKEFIRYRECVDRFFPRASSFNVIGKIQPDRSQPSQRIVLFCGHHDSALQFTWLRYLKYGYYPVVLILLFGNVLWPGALGLRLLLLFLGLPCPSLTWSLQFLAVTVVPLAILFSLFFVERGKNGGKVPGATDNLSGSALATTLGRILKKNPELIPKNTEVRLVSFGCEEAGLRGAKAYVKKHLEELRTKEVLCVNMDTIVDPELIVFSSDLNGFLKHSPEAIQRVVQAAKQAEVPLKVLPFPLGGGGTDAAAFTEAGIDAATLYSMKVPSQMIDFYHQEFDTPDKLNEKGLENTLLVCVAILKDMREIQSSQTIEKW